MNGDTKYEALFFYFFPIYDIYTLGKMMGQSITLFICDLTAEEIIDGTGRIGSGIYDVNRCGDAMSVDSDGEAL